MGAKLLWALTQQGIKVLFENSEHPAVTGCLVIRCRKVIRGKEYQIKTLIDPIDIHADHSDTALERELRRIKALLLEACILEAWLLCCIVWWGHN